MKNAYPSREKDRFQHALTRPLTRRTTYEVIELMRADLFQYLDLITTNAADDSKESCAWHNREIQRIADRLKELTPYRVRAARAALRAGRIDFAINIDPDDHTPPPACGPFSGPGWLELHRQWEAAR